jgi:hypothetical protein
MNRARAAVVKCVGSGGMLILAKEYIDEHGGDGIRADLCGQEANGRLSRHLAERGHVSTEVDEALSVQAGLLLRALGP